MAGLLCVMVLVIALVPVIIGMWMMFEKAGEPGVASIVPIWNTIVLCRIGGCPEWWFILFCIPMVNLVVSVIVFIGVCRNFDRDIGFAIGAVFLPFIFLPILGLGSARHVSDRRRGPYGVDRPRKRKRPRYEEDEEEDRPRKPRRPRYEDDDRIQKQPRPRSEDEDEDRPRPRRPRREDDDEDDRPRKPRRPRYEDED